MGRGVREDDLEAVERVDRLVGWVGELKALMICEDAVVPIVAALGELSGVLHCAIGERLARLLLRTQPHMRHEAERLRDRLSEILDDAGR